MTDKKKPVETLRLSPLSAAIWENKTAEGVPLYSVTFERTYKDKEGKLQNTDSFSRYDLLVLSKLANWAHTRVEDLRKAAAPPDESPAEAEAQAPSPEPLPY